MGNGDERNGGNHRPFEQWLTEIEREIAEVKMDFREFETKFENLLHMGSQVSRQEAEEWETSGKNASN